MGDGSERLKNRWVQRLSVYHACCSLPCSTPFPFIWYLILWVIMVSCLLAVPFWRCPPFCLGVFTFHLVFREQEKTSESGRATSVHSKLAKWTSGMSRLGRGGATHCTAAWGHGSCWQILNPNSNYTETLGIGE